MRALRVPGLLVLAAGLAFVGWLLMSTNFMIHDDEGYVLLGLRDFAVHGGLYDKVFTQYGPTPFLYYEGLHRAFGWPITNLLGRNMTLVHWVGAAFAAGLIAWRLSGRYWTALFTLVAVFGYLWQMTWEPPHPGGLIALIIAASLAAAAEATWRGRTGLCALILGLAGAALILTKINIGLLWCCSTGAFLLLTTGHPLLRRHGSWLAAAGLAALPFVLMQPLLGEAWVLKLAVMSAASGIAICLLAGGEDTRGSQFRDWWVALGSFTVLGLVIVSGVLVQGTSLHGLIQGVLLDPLRHPSNFHFGPSWQPWAWAVLALAVIAAVLWRSKPAWRGTIADLASGLRLLALLCFACNLRPWLSLFGVGYFISYVLPLTPLFLLPVVESADGGRRRQTALLVALVGLAQVLHTYPVAGSQMAWGSFLLLPLFVSGLSDAALHLSDRMRQPWVAIAVATFALGAAGFQTYLLADQGWLRWSTSEPLGLAGAETVRPPENVRYALRILTANAELHADLLYSRPGMFSFNLWSGVPTPTLRNATHWFWLLTPDDQQAIITSLRATPRSAIISSRPLVEFLDQRMNMTITGPLNDYIRANYRTLFTVSGYDFLVPTASHASPFFVAQNLEQRPGGGSERGLITVNVAVQATVAHIVLRLVEQPARILAAWQADNSRVTLERINAAGQLAGPPQDCPWPLKLDGLHQLQLYHNLPVPAGRPGLELVFLDAEGRSLFEACYDDPVSASAPPAGG